MYRGSLLKSHFYNFSEKIVLFANDNLCSLLSNPPPPVLFSFLIALASNARSILNKWGWLCFIFYYNRSSSSISSLIKILADELNDTKILFFSTHKPNGSMHFSVSGRFYNFLVSFGYPNPSRLQSCLSPPLPPCCDLRALQRGGHLS